ncbi:MAG: hypothetical protein LBW85_07420 [Deltaproteobacteria bacterium]|nr:hypothetical protein [Deltaproteobacteria bacterium]
MSIWPHLNERQRRFYAASEARAIGYGGISIVSRISGLSRMTVTKGVRELGQPPLEGGRARLRRPGRRGAETVPQALEALEAIIRPEGREGPAEAMAWTCLSARQIAGELDRLGHSVGPRRVGPLLGAIGLRPGNSARGSRPGWDAQFSRVNWEIREAMAGGRPVIAVTAGKAAPEDSSLDRGPGPPAGEARGLPPAAAASGIYGFGKEEGFLNVLTGRDPAEFAAASIRGWWRREGNKAFPGADYILVAADGGGTGFFRSRPWKCGLGRLASETGIPVKVCFLPPCACRRNVPEARLFSFVSSSLKGRPRRDTETAASLLGAAPGKAPGGGLRLTVRLDRLGRGTGTGPARPPERGFRVERDPFRGDWNYTLVNIGPKSRPPRRLMPAEAGAGQR